MQSIGRSTRWFLALSLLLLFVIYFAPHLSTGIFKDDDVTISWMGFTKEILKPSFEWGAAQGRFFFLIATPIWTMPYWIDHPIYFHGIRLVAHLGVFLSLLYLVWTLTRDQTLTTLTGAFFCAFLANHLGYNAMTGCTPGYHLSMIGIMLSAAFFYRSLHGNVRWGLATGACFLISLLMTENGFAYLPFFVFIVWLFKPAMRTELKRPWASIKPLLKLFAPLIGAAVLFLIPYVGFKLKWPSSYLGNQINLDLKKFFSSLWMYSWELFPGVSATGPGAEHIIGMFTPDYGRVYSKARLIVESMQISWFLKAVLISSVLVFISSKRPEERWSVRNLTKALLVCLALVFTPNALVSMTYKYQNWIDRVYLFSTFSYLAICVLLAFAYFFMLKLAQRPIARTLVVCASICLASIWSLQTDYFNHHAFLLQAKVHAQWLSFKAAYASPIIHRDKKNVIFAPDFLEPGIPEWYWTRSIKALKGRDTVVTKDWDEFRRLSSDRIPFVLREITDSYSTDRFVVFAKVSLPIPEIPDLKLLKSKRIGILDFSKRSRIRVIGETAPSFKGDRLSVQSYPESEIRRSAFHGFDFRVQKYYSHKPYFLSVSATNYDLRPGKVLVSYFPEAELW